MFKAGVVAGVLLFANVGAAHAQDDADTKVEEKAPPKWAGSEVSLRHGYGIVGLDAGAELTYNPTFVQAISIDPRWRLNKKINLTAHLGVETELTNSDYTSYERQPLLDDTFVQASYALPKLPWKLVGSAGLRLTLPTSKESLARETLFNLAPSASLSRSFKLTDKIVVSPFVSLRLGLTFATAQELTYDAPTIASCDLGSETCDQFSHSPVRSSFLGLTETVGADVSLPYKLNAQLLMSMVQSRLYPCHDVMGTTADPTAVVVCNDDAPNWRYVNVYLIEVGWDTPIRHVHVSGGFQTVNPQQKPDSSTYRPFINRYTEVFFKGAYVF